MNQIQILDISGLFVLAHFIKYFYAFEHHMETLNQWIFLLMTQATNVYLFFS